MLFVGARRPWQQHSLPQQMVEFGQYVYKIQSSPGTIQSLDWYKLKISLRGTRIHIELDDHMLFDCADDFSQKGGVGLRCEHSAARFRNIKVTAPDGTILWEGLPDLPKE